MIFTVSVSFSTILTSIRLALTSVFPANTGTSQIYYYYYDFLEFPAPKKLTTRNAVRDKQTIHNQWQKHIRIQYKAMFIKQTYLQYNRQLIAWIP